MINVAAGSYGFSRSVEQGARFQHVVFRNDRPATGNRLHVYIEGDGIAWRSRFLISADPTPSAALMLRLMAFDRNRAVYLGRPCYFGLSDAGSCDADYWTYRRFSPEVVDSMVRAIERETGSNDGVVLFGHSGGAALAMLIAGRLPQTESVVTVAGNLDVSAWVAHHRYTPLHGSLNPAQQPVLPAHIRQLHLLGGRDRKIPPALIEPWLATQSAARVWRFADYTHGCCWHNQWPSVLRWVAGDERIRAAVAGNRRPFTDVPPSR